MKTKNSSFKCVLVALDRFFSDSAIEGLKCCDVSGSMELENMYSGDLSKDSKGSTSCVDGLAPD